MRLRADFWVAAYLRTCNREAPMAVLRRRGAPEAGAIYVKLDCLDGRAALFGPAPMLDDGGIVERRFIRLHRNPWIAPLDAESKLVRAVEFDSDIWVVELENRDGDPMVDLVEG